jgi:hypothetical protein
MIKPPAALKCENALVDAAVALALKNNPHLHDFAFFMSSFLLPQYHGSQMPIRGLIGLLKYLKEERGIRGMYAVNIAP